MLKKKDLFMNWWVPTKGGHHATRSIGEVLRVYIEKNRNTITISKALCEALSLSLSEVKIAFVFDDEQPFITFNPAEGVPFITLKASGKNRSPYIARKELVLQISEAFGLDKHCKYYDFKVTFWQRFNGMNLYIMEPQEGGCT